MYGFHRYPVTSVTRTIDSWRRSGKSFEAENSEEVPQVDWEHFDITGNPWKGSEIYDFHRSLAFQSVRSIKQGYDAFYRVFCRCSLEENASRRLGSLDIIEHPQSFESKCFSALFSS